jgi:Cdc6-like AAA superfamily ATPase
MADFESKLQRRGALAKVFTPAAPVSTREAFSGRYEQITAVIESVAEPGRHVVLFGERGVGKTSLANILSELYKWDDGRVFARRITCNADDTFKTIWRRVFSELGIEEPEEWKSEQPNPDHIRKLLQNLVPPTVIVLDEYDRVDDDESLSRMADTIKALADHAVGTKLVIVGVSDSIELLIGEHESIKRNLREVQMPRMTNLELMQVVARGFASVDMDIEDDALIRISRISEGLPSYAHLVALKAGGKAIDDDRTIVTLAHVSAATETVLESHMNRMTYLRAIQSSRSGNLYAQVLVACALAKKDELGYFAAKDVRDPLSRIMGKSYDIPAFAKHLNAFMDPERGAVLQRRGPERSYRYRFADPIMQPYALLSGIAASLIPSDYVDELFAPDPAIDWDGMLQKISEEYDVTPAEDEGL